MIKRAIGRMAWLAAAVTVILTVPAAADQISVATTGAFREAIGELAPAFERASGHIVSVSFAGTDDIVRRLAAGETLDLVIAPAPVIDALTARGLLSPGSRADVARSGIGIAARLGAPRIDISSAEALRNAVLTVPSMVLSAGVSGVYLNGLFRKWGIAEQLKAKTVTLPGSGPVAEAIARGQADIGFLQVSEWLAVKDIVFLGPLPAEIQEMTAITAGLGRASAAADVARAFLRFLLSPEAAGAKTRSGLEPG
jgi:molybdate transport system substrate-binding protein